MSFGGAVGLKTLRRDLEMLTPRDIQNKLFKISIKGYNVGQVDDFMREMCSNYDELYKENAKNKEYIELLSGAVGQYKSMEESIREAMSAADKSINEMEQAAIKRADDIIRNAEGIAESIIAGAEQKISEEQHRLDSIKQETEVYRNKMIELLSAHLSVISGYPVSGRNEADAAAKWFENIGGAVENAKNRLKYDKDKKNFEFEDTASIHMPELNDTEFVTEKIILAEEDATDKLPRIFLNENGEYVQKA